jgi:hypothetical protein
VCERERESERERDRERNWGRYEIDNMRTKGWRLLFYYGASAETDAMG